MRTSYYKKLAKRLNELPNGFPPTKDGAELRLLEAIFTPEEAALAAELRMTLETSKEIAERLDVDRKDLRKILKSMARKGLIEIGRAEKGLGFGLMPFVVGIYEMQIARLNEEMAHLFENYYQQAFRTMTEVSPQFHRVIPVQEAVQTGMKIDPYESAVNIVSSAKAWGVVDCICRKQKALIGDPCEHPLDVCMILSDRSSAFDGKKVIQAQTLEESLATLKKAAEAGLVHSVTNAKDNNTYICNCCTCSCGILRGMSEMGMANVVARSAFVNQVDSKLCVGCKICVDYCQFDALSLDEEEVVIEVQGVSCVGCGVCVPACPEGALILVRRPEEEILEIPDTEEEWEEQRAIARGIDINLVR